MAKNKYTENDLIALGLVQRDDGTWYKPIIKSPFIKQQEAINEGMVVREPVKETPDFQYEIKTEWFIRGYSVPSKKNNRQNFVKNGKQISIPSKQYAEYKKMTAMQYQVFGREFVKAVEALSLSYPLRVQFTFIRNTKHRFDYCNACQSCEDIMVENGWIKDDSADYIIPVFMPYEYDKENPGVKIKLLK